jgi:L-fucose mutarotase
MLKGISPLLSPELLDALFRMGHGDEIVLADAHFPGYSCNRKIIRADGLMISDLLKAILPLIELDSYVDSPLIMMGAVEGDHLDPEVEGDYLAAIHKTNPHQDKIERIDRFSFYERAGRAFAIVMTGETRKYGNIILKKGVITV